MNIRISDCSHAQFWIVDINWKNEYPISEKSRSDVWERPSITHHHCWSQCVTQTMLEAFSCTDQIKYSTRQTNSIASIQSNNSIPGLRDQFCSDQCRAMLPIALEIHTTNPASVMLIERHPVNEVDRMHFCNPEDPILQHPTVVKRCVKLRDRIFCTISTKNQKFPKYVDFSDYR